MHGLHQVGREPCKWLLAPILLALAQHASASEPEEQNQVGVVALSADQMLDFADRSARSGDLATAEATYRALFGDPALEVRSEARFRLAMLFAGMSRLADAAVLLRRILDEQPEAQRVRLELARVLDLMGDEPGARRTLREAQAGGLPPEVARFVDRYSAALRARKPLGGSLEISLAPDSNINRATRSGTLGTVLGDFDLDEDAMKQSGVGLGLRGQAYARIPASTSVNLFGRASGFANLYRKDDFNDLAVAITVGPELQIGADRFSFEAGGLWQWYGGKSYSRSATLGANYFHPLGRSSQLRGTASLAVVDNLFNSLQDGEIYAGSVGYERAISSRAGFSLTMSGERQSLHDPGYSTWAAQASISAYREVGATTLIATIGRGWLWADERLLLFPRARSDRLDRASLGATFRQARIDNFAPFVRATLERNHSTTEIYDYSRSRFEVGLARAF